MTRDTYSVIAEEYNKANFNPFWNDEFKKFKQLIPGKKVIDIGCGAGRDAVVFTQENFDYTGIDTSPEMLAIAKQRAPKGTYIEMDFFDLQFKDNTFDCFWATASFLHVPKNEIKNVLLEAKRGWCWLYFLKRKRQYGRRNDYTKSFLGNHFPLFCILYC